MLLLIIVLVPIGKIAPDLTSWLQKEIPKIVHSQVTTAAEMSVPQSAYHSERSQFLGDDILANLRAHIHPASPEERFVGLLDADSYAPGLNFIFGQALPGGPAAFVALPRLRSSDQNLYRERVLKEVIHELGHTWNLPHCPNEKCVMHFSNSLADTDRKSHDFCDLCRKKLRL
jgi:archaemetzincin